MNKKNDKTKLHETIEKAIESDGYYKEFYLKKKTDLNDWDRGELEYSREICRKLAKPRLEKLWIALLKISEDLFKRTVSKILNFKRVFHGSIHVVQTNKKAIAEMKQLRKAVIKLRDAIEGLNDVFLLPNNRHLKSHVLDALEMYEQHLGLIISQYPKGDSFYKNPTFLHPLPLNRESFKQSAEAREFAMTMYNWLQEELGESVAKYVDELVGSIYEDERYGEGEIRKMIHKRKSKGR